jgi:hypothetical protein
MVSLFRFQVYGRAGRGGNASRGLNCQHRGALGIWLGLPWFDWGFDLGCLGPTWDGLVSLGSTWFDLARLGFRMD